MNTTIKEPGEMSYPKLNTESDTTLEKPDLEQLRHDRLERNIEVMKVQLSSQLFYALLLFCKMTGLWSFSFWKPL